MLSHTSVNCQCALCVWMNWRTHRIDIRLATSVWRTKVNEFPRIVQRKPLCERQSINNNKSNRPLLPVQGTCIHHSIVSAFHLRKTNRDYFLIDLFESVVKILYACHRPIMCVQRQGFDSHVFVCNVCAFFSLPLISWFNSIGTMNIVYVRVCLSVFCFPLFFVFFFFSNTFHVAFDLPLIFVRSKFQAK